MERHVLAHELGHAILHPKTNITAIENLPIEHIKIKLNYI